MKSISYTNQCSFLLRRTPVKRVVEVVLLLMLLLWISPASGKDTAANAMQRGSDLMVAAQFDQAASVYESVVKTAKSGSTLQAQAMFRLGLALQRQKRYELALENYTLALKAESLSPADTAEVRKEAGYCEMASGHFDEAGAWLAQVVTDPQASPITRSVANLYSSTVFLKVDQRDDTKLHRDDAIECLMRVTRQSDTDPHYVASAWVSLGNLYALNNQIDQARDAYRAVLKVTETGTKAARARTELVELELRAKPDTALFMPPWVVSVSRDTAVLHWLAKGDAAPATIQFDSPGVKSQIQRVSKIHSGYFLYRATVTGLKGSQLYKYTMTCPDSQIAGEFHTPSSIDDPITFCVLGDTQSRANVHTKIANLIAAQNPRFVLHAGDCVERGGDFLQWYTQLMGPAQPYLKKGPLYPARGNHDGGPYFPQLFNLIPDQHYSVDQGLVHAVFLDAFGPGAKRDSLPAQAKWLDEVFSASTSPWKVIVLHDPMVNGDLRNAWWGLEHFMPVIEKHGVAAVFSGHHHKYRRFLPLHPPGKPQAGATWHITTGGSGGTLSGKTFTPLTVRMELIYHFVRVDANVKTMNMTVIDIDGNTLDTITLSRDSQGRVHSSTEQPVDREEASQIIKLYSHLAATRHDPDLIETVWQDGKLLIDFNRLRQGVMPTEDMPEQFALHIQAVQGSAWNVPAQTFSLRGVRKISITATEPAGDNPPPLQLTLTPMLGDRALIPRIFNVNVIPVKSFNNQEQAKGAKQ